MYDYDSYKFSSKSAWEEVEKEILKEERKLEEGCVGGACTIGGAPSTAKQSGNITGGSGVLGSLRGKHLNLKKSQVVVMEDIDGTTKEVVITDVSSNIKEGRSGFKGFYMENPEQHTWGFNEDVKVILGTIESLLEAELNENGGTGSVAVVPGNGVESPAIARVKTRVGEKPCDDEEDGKKKPTKRME